MLKTDLETMMEKLTNAYYLLPNFLDLQEAISSIFHYGKNIDWIFFYKVLIFLEILMKNIYY